MFGTTRLKNEIAELRQRLQEQLAQVSRAVQERYSLR